jgi:rubrerythrin
MKGVGSTADNLQTAIAGETCEYQKMYPVFLKEAEVEKNQPAVFTFQNAMAVEETHAKLYAQALEAVKAGKDLPAAPLFVCEVCGHTAVGSAPDICPVCKARKEKFAEVR